MNMFDRALQAISPTTALKREKARITLSRIADVKASAGYGHSGGSTQKKSMVGWNSMSGSPQQDIDPHLHLLRERSRDLFMSSPLAASAINTKRTNIVGPGLQLKARLDHEYLGLTKAQASAIEKQIEREFALFANTRNCDALRLNNFYELQALACLAWFLNGETIGLVKYKDPTKWAPYGLRIHLVEADRVSTPDNVPMQLASWAPKRVNTVGKNKENNHMIYNGIEVADDGEIVAYWVCNQYPTGANLTGKKREWTRVEAYGEETGNPNVLHVMDPERCEQYRGVPFLAPVLEALKQITRYQEAELMAALVQALYTVFIEVDGETGEQPFGEMFATEDLIDDDEHSYELGPGAVNVLAKGEKAVFADPKRPASGFESFVLSMAKMVGAALEIPQEILLKSFTASYSASRAALLEMWKSIKMDRSRFVADFCQPIYEIWLSEAVARGRIHAPGFFNDPTTKAAWCKAEWTGPTQGQIDPVKEVNAAVTRINNAFSTHEQETIALTGGNWDDNVAQLALEREALDKIHGKERGEDDAEHDPE